MNLLQSTTSDFAFSENEEEMKAVSLLDLALAIKDADQKLVFNQRGYMFKRLYQCTAQGELIVVENEKEQTFMVKKVSKYLTAKQEITDQDGFHYITDTNIINEAFVLQYLTHFCSKINNSVPKYCDFFETDSDYYLVMQYIEKNMTLKQFVNECHRYIQSGKLKLKQYHKIIKFLLWQLAATLYWLHNKIKCMFNIF